MNLRVLLVAHGYPPELSGGTERYTRHVAEALVQRGHGVTVVAGTLAWRERLAVSEEQAGGVRVLRVHRDDAHPETWDRGHAPAVAERFAAILDEVRPHVVHVQHWIRLTRDLVRTAHRAGIPALVTLHDFHATCPTHFRVLPDGTTCTVPAAGPVCSGCVRGSWWWAEDELDAEVRLHAADLRNELDLAQRVLVLSAAQARLLAQVTGRAESTFVVHPFRALVPLRRGPVPPPAPPLRIASWGQLWSLKGQHVLLDAVRAMRHRAEVLVELFGSGAEPGYEERLRAAAEGLPVKFRGAYAPADLERHPMHLAVFPSLANETFGFVIEEARMLGVPVVVSDAGAYPERIGAGGVVVPRGDAAALAALLDRCVEAPAEVERLRAGVVAPGPFAEHVNHLEDLYRHVAAYPEPRRDHFDLEGHLRHAQRRYEARERHLAGLEAERRQRKGP
ncbi:MAG: glycosyltransferase [Planctomycetes bacterium]|nr:glycosyltransferase [Planctomycetota bacterium]